MAHRQESDICNMKAKFMEWVDSNPRHNSSLLTKRQYDDIRSFLKPNDKSRFDKNLRKRLVKNQYETIQFPALNIGEILCIL